MSPELLKLANQQKTREVRTIASDEGLLAHLDLGDVVDSVI